MNKVKIEVKSPVWESGKTDCPNISPLDVHEIWFESIAILEETENAVVLGIQNYFPAIWIQENYLDVIAETFDIALGYQVYETLGVAKDDGGQLQQVDKPKHQSKCKPEQKARETGLLSPKNTFENLVHRSGNQMAHATCIAVASVPGFPRIRSFSTAIRTWGKPT